jgi:tetratricopeptide (TPR) repeat protein
MKKSMRLALAVSTLALACSSPKVDHAAHGGAAAAAPPVLYDSLGSYAYRVTATPEAQRWFDQGLRLVYGFNHQEAQRAFREAARLDPRCAMCFWGLALTEGGNYNHPTDADREARALEAVQQAQRLAAGARPVERAMIAAVARRHSADRGTARESLDRAYADAMRDVARQFPDDLEAATFFADAMMNLRPWNLWTPDGTPQPGTEELVQTLERVLAKDPNHPGAIHLYIHAVEASAQPERAEAAADRLAALMPGAGHLVHMPSHIYWRVGRYDDAVKTNAAAVEADRAYFKTAQPSPIYRGLYYPHNIDFIWQSASMQGRSAETIRVAREFAAMGRGASSARAAGGVALHVRRVALRARAGVARQGPGGGGGGRAAAARGRHRRGAARAHHRLLLPRQERAAAGRQRPGRRDRGQGR